MRNLKPVKVGNCTLDGSHIYIQSMLNTRSDDIAGSVAQAVALEQAGCEIVRAAIPNHEAIALIPAIKEKISIPLVADIHFDYRLALEAAEAGIDKIRINPGNIGGMSRVQAVVKACQARNIPIRIGVNSGSLEKEILAKYGAPTAEALVESAMGHVQMLEACGFDDIVISMKSSDVNTMIDAYRLCAQQCSYPLHLGVTEAGTERMGLIKSAIGIGSRRHRRNHSCFSDRRPGKGNQGCQRYSQVYRQAWGTADRLLSHLRQNPDRPGENCQGSRGCPRKRG